MRNDIFTASQLSDGTLRFICIATLLLQPEEIMQSTIIVDEPELGLHPFAITVLAELVKSVSQKKQLIDWLYEHTDSDYADCVVRKNAEDILRIKKYVP